MAFEIAGVKPTMNFDIVIIGFCERIEYCFTPSGVNVFVSIFVCFVQPSPEGQGYGLLFCFDLFRKSAYIELKLRSTPLYSPLASFCHTRI